MLYVQRGLETNKMKPVPSNGTDFETLVQANTTILDKDDKIKIYNMNNNKPETVAKGQKCHYFIAGSMTSDTRQKANIANKSLLVLDYDNDQPEPMPLEYMLDAIKGALKDYTYYLYPSTSFSMKRPKLRVIVEPERVMNDREVKATTAQLGKLVGIPLDPSSGDYARMFGLPCADNLEEFNSIRTINYGVKFPVATEAISSDEQIRGLFAGEEDDEQEPQHRRSKTITQLERVMTGIGEGGRNTTIASVYGTLVKARMQPDKATELLWLLNTAYFQPPLDATEFASVIRSITKIAKEGS